MAWTTLRGHDRVIDQFRTAVRRGRLGHAYLLVGPAGVGKRTFARELAKALLCDAPPDTMSACDHCASCHLVSAGTHPDFMIVRKPEDKLEFPVDTMHDFLKDLGLKPSRGTRKIALVEDAETFNEESANAFLKTLEEPPPGSLLLLRATSLETQLTTIRSRCQPVTFHALPTETVITILRGREDIPADRLDRLAMMSRGSAGLAAALNDDALWQFRNTLLDALAAGRFPAATLAENWTKFNEAAGKESAAQRGRAALALQLLIDVLMAALRLALGGDPHSNDDRRLQAFARRVGDDKLLDCLDAALEADRHVDQRVNLAMTIELLIDRLALAA